MIDNIQGGQLMKTKKYYFKWGLTVFLTVCAILVF